jgi:hypothetical protein
MTRPQTEMMYQRFIAGREDCDICWTYNSRERGISVNKKSDLETEVRLINKSGDYECLEENNIEVSDDEGRTYYCLTFQDKFNQENNAPNGFHILKFGEMVDGETFYFFDKEMRDTVSKCVNNRKALDDGNKVLCWNGNDFDVTEKYTCSVCYRGFEDAQNIKNKVMCCEICKQLKFMKHLEMLKLEKQKEELEKEIKIRQEKAEKLAEQLISESDGSVESEKSKNSNSSEEKSKTRQANKNRDAKKKEKEEFLKRAAECARILAQQEAKKIALKRAKAKAQKK